LQTYDGKNYADAYKIFDMNIYSPLLLEEEMGKKQLNVFSYDKQTYNMSVPYNLNLIKFYNDYPLCEMSVYMNTPLSSFTLTNLWAEFKPYFQNHSDTEQVKLLLNFTQFAFDYKDDLEYHGREKYYFPDELFYYDFSDCEDRAALFAALIRHFTDFDVIGLEYDIHMATAVAFKDKITGSNIQYNNTKYTVCDPTYIGASIGAAMPRFEKSPFKIVPAGRNHNLQKTKDNLWGNIASGGGYRGDCNFDMAPDSKGNLCATGYFDEIFKYGEVSIKAKENKKNLFIIKTTSEGKPYWIRTFSGDGQIIPYALTTDVTGNSYLCGSFEKTITAYGASVTTEKPDVFVMKFSPSGNVEWIKKTGVNDFIKEDQGNYYTAKLDSKGNLLVIQADTMFENNSGVFIKADAEGNTFICGARKPSLLSSQQTEKNLGYFLNLNLGEYLSTQTLELINQNYHKATAPFVASINYLGKIGAEVDGNTAKEFLVRNSSLVTENTDIYRCLGKIVSFKNYYGEISTQTKSNDTIHTNSFKISNDARFVLKIGDHNFKIEVKNGVCIYDEGKCYKLESVEIFKEGKVLIGFDNGKYKQLPYTKSYTY